MIRTNNFSLQLKKKLVLNFSVSHKKIACALFYTRGKIKMYEFPVVEDTYLFLGMKRNIENQNYMNGLSC